MTISRKFWMKFLSVTLLVLLLLETIETKPYKRGKRKNHAKHCGTRGHPCQPGSRKLCCAAGYTCKVTEIASNWTKPQRKRKRKIGTCQPVLPIRVSEREIEEVHPKPEFHSNPAFLL